jgi:hypothetical protein
LISFVTSNSMLIMTKEPPKQQELTHERVRLYLKEEYGLSDEQIQEMELNRQKQKEEHWALKGLNEGVMRDVARGWTLEVSPYKPMPLNPRGKVKIYHLGESNPTQKLTQDERDDIYLREVYGLSDQEIQELSKKRDLRLSQKQASPPSEESK